VTLPAPAEAIVGRAADLAAIDALIAADERLVTLTGPAGAGKTRLGLEAALGFATHGAAERADLGEARDLAGLCDAVALALGAGGDRGEDPVARLGRAIAGRGEILILLDDFDAVLGHAAESVGRWMTMAPEAIFLVTSRERLRLPGEAVHEVGPLSLAEGEATSEAVELFVRAARRARGSFALSPAEAPYVAAIVKELDGLPLAIELAAPRMAVMGARALLHRLGSRFEVLRRGGAGKHATLEAALDSSTQALHPWEAEALAQCTVFRGGFTLEAAEAVIDVRAHPGAPHALDVVAALREKSLLYGYEPRGARGEIRLGMYASIREHAGRRLAPEAMRAAEARHAEAVVRAAEGWAQRGVGREAAEARARILLERDNLLAVLERVTARRPVTARTAEPALRALLVLAPVVTDEAPLGAYVNLLDPVLAATADSGADPRLAAHALAVRGALLRRRGLALPGSRDLVRALSAATTLGDRHLEARVVHELGHALAGRGEAQLAAEHFERALALYRGTGDRAGMGDALHSLGAALARRGKLAEAAPVAERALALHRAELHPAAEAADLRLVAEIALDAGRLDDARARLAEARALSRDLGDRRGEVLALGLEGLADDLGGALAAARAAYDRAAASLRELGLSSLEALFAGRAGVLAAREGRTAEAFALLSAACGDLDAEAAPVRRAVFLAHLAALDAHVGRAGEAPALIDEAEKRLAGQDAAPARALLDLARGDLDAASAPAALAAARALAPESAELRLALACRARLTADDARRAPPPPDDALLVGPAGRWFRAPHGERIPLDQRRQLALLLDRLIAERLARPGAALAWDALLEAGWPGERVIAAAGAHRVRVALSTLRKLGLKDVLVTTPDGYLLAAEVQAQRVD
jgi:predicted ATPase